MSLIYIAHAATAQLPKNPEPFGKHVGLVKFAENGNSRARNELIKTSIPRLGIFLAEYPNSRSIVDFSTMKLARDVNMAKTRASAGVKVQLTPADSSRVRRLGVKTISSQT